MNNQEIKDALLAAIWLGLGLIVTAFWLWLAVLFWPTVQRLLEDAGRLNACAGHVAECAAVAEAL